MHSSYETSGAYDTIYMSEFVKRILWKGNTDMIGNLQRKTVHTEDFMKIKKITEDELKELVDTGRNTPSAANRQCGKI